jgi:hypothetical protein
MQHLRYIASRVILAVGLCVAVACDQSPLAPTRFDDTRAGESSQLPSSIEITGAESVIPGETAQLTATARFTDGQRDVTGEVIWSTSNPDVMTVSATGSVSARDRGEVTIRAFLNGVQGSRTTFSLPRGTYRLSGSVRLGSAPVNGAVIEVLSGAGTGLSAATEDGRYRIYGVAGDTRVQVTMTDCETERQMIDINRHETLDFELQPVPRPQQRTGAR